MKLTPIKANMTEIQLGEVKVLFSYQTPVATYCEESGKFRRTTKKWSRTTSKHINQWTFKLEKEGRIVVESTPQEQDFFDNLVK